MNRSHEHIEKLLGKQAHTGSVSAGFRDRVAEGISRAEPGALPVGNPVLPASVKGAITLGAVGVVSLGIWFAVLAEPSAPQTPVVNNGNTTIVENSGAETESVFAALKNLGSEFAKDKDNEAKTDIFAEGRRFIADVVRVGEAFASVFPSQWRDLILGPTRRSPGAPASDPASKLAEPGTLQG